MVGAIETRARRAGGGRAGGCAVGLEVRAAHTLGSGPSTPAPRLAAVHSAARPQANDFPSL